MALNEFDLVVTVAVVSFILIRHTRFGMNGEYERMKSEGETVDEYLRRPEVVKDKIAHMTLLIVFLVMSIGVYFRIWSISLVARGIIAFGSYFLLTAVLSAITSSKRDSLSK